MFIKKKLRITPCLPAGRNYELRSPFGGRKRGFTVMELVLYMGLLMIILVVLAQLFTTSIESQLDSQQFSAVQQDGRFILNRLIYDIQNATSVTTPGALGAQTSTLVIAVSGTTYTYSLTGPNMHLNGVRLNGYNTSVSNLTFQKLGNAEGKPTIKLGFTLTSLTTKNGVTDVKNYQTTVGLK